MKLVHIFTRFKTYSGAEHLAFRLCQEAVRRGDEVTIVTRHIPEHLVRHLPDAVEIRALRFAHTPTRFHFFESLCDVLYSVFLFRLVPTGSDCDVYWNDNTMSSLFLDSLMRKKLRVFYCLQLPHFAYGQTMLVARSYPPLSWLVPIFVPLYRWLDKLFAQRADCIVTISNMVKDDCVRVYRDKEVFVGTLGVDPPVPELVERDFVRRMLPIHSQHILLTIGKLIPKKNVELFVEILGILRSRGCDVSGVIVGDGPMRPRIERRIRELELQEFCLMTGFVEDYGDVLRYLSGATVYVYLEKNVPFGLTVVEAGAVGVPVVAFSGGGVEETIADGINGYRISLDHDADAIADLLDRTLRDPKQLADLGLGGRSMAAERTWKRSYDRFREILSQRLARYVLDSE